MIPRDRNSQFAHATEAFRRRRGKTIVEIGSIRIRGNVDGDGYSTVVWAQCAEKVYSVDIDPAATALTKEETAKFGNVVAITADGLGFLRGFAEPIDLLYLDAWDVGTLNFELNHLIAFLAALKNLHAGSLVMIDDCFWREDLGKGSLVIPAAKELGFRLAFVEYMAFLEKP